MNKILVEIFCPSISKSFDFWLPKKMNVKRAISLIVEEIKSYENNATLFSNAEEVLLFSNEAGYLDKSNTFENLGINSGDTLIIV